MKHRPSPGFPRMISAAIVALALACARSIEAQDAPAPVSTPRPLPGVADIDFSLDGRVTENAGTPTEGPARPAASASPVAPDASLRASPAPNAASTGPGEGDAAVRRQAGPADDQVSAPSTVDPELTESPLPDASPPSLSGEAGETVSPGSSAAIADAPAMPAWLFGLSLLAMATWFAFRRLRKRAPQEEHREVAGRETPPLYRAPDPPLAQPEVAAAPVPPPRPRARIVRYDAMGLPILD